MTTHELAANLAPRVWWSKPPFLWVQLAFLSVFSRLLTSLSRMTRRHYRVWIWCTRHYSKVFNRLAWWHAYLMCARGKKRVPAYARFLEDNGHQPHLLSLGCFFETTKENYVTVYSQEDRCMYGKVPIGVAVDESAGSSGKPYNWLRSADELEDVHANTAHWVRFMYPTERLFSINAFSMGAWATGTNMGIALGRVSIVKSTGPDLEKIIDTIETFGTKYDYLIAAYPPFLKHIADELDKRNFDWSSTRMYGLVGGEGMTEALREYLERRFLKVRSGYGASDIQIGVAGENDFTVAVRRAIMANNELRYALLRDNEDRIPMVFQYNPLDTFIEINERSESVVTMNSTKVLAPKLRYNVGDEALLREFSDTVKLLRKYDPDGPWRRGKLPDHWTTPLYILFGRRDSTISYMGANIYPQDVEYGLYMNPENAANIESFMMELRENESLESRPVVHIQFREDVDIASVALEKLRAAYRAGLLKHLCSVSRDFAESIQEDPSAAELAIEFHSFSTGPFSSVSQHIKNVYVLKP
jgi:phenylacetate-CoA ligase